MPVRTAHASPDEASALFDAYGERIRRYIAFRVRSTEDADDLTRFHGGKKTTHEVVFAHRCVAVHGAIALDQAIHVDVVQITHHHVHPVTVQGMYEGGELPAAKVSGEKQHTFAAGKGAFVR